MFAICIEASHEKGMGHLFRALNFIKLLNEKNEKYILLINNDEKSILLLRNYKIKFEIIDLEDYETDWESVIIKKYGITIWLNDRLDTDKRHSKNVKKSKIKLVVFDDNGTGSELADVNFGGLALDDSIALKGNKIFKGTKYLILNSDIEKYKRIRTDLGKILVTLGGSDTYGVTLKVISGLKLLGCYADIFIGPSFSHEKELIELAGDKFKIRKNVKSLIKEFYKYDLAITGGGITPFEANASGLPCIVIASEIHEIKNGKYLDNLGSSKFIGYYKNIKIEKWILDLNIQSMSCIGIKNITVNGSNNIYNIIKMED